MSGNFSFPNLHPMLGDSDNVLLAKIARRLALNAEVAVDEPSTNVAVTNTPLPVTVEGTPSFSVSGTPTVDANITNATIAVTSSGEFEALTHEHAKVHEGNAFLFSEVVSIANGATYYWMVTTPVAPTQVHLIPNVIGTVAHTFSVYEAPTSPVGGVAMTLVARNRHNSNPNQVNGVSNLTVGGTGTLLYTHRSPGAVVSTGMVSILSNSEFVLAHATNYLFACTAHAPSGFFTLQLNWYLQ